MNLPPFYIGQKVICTYSGLWLDSETEQITTGPKANETCTVIGYENIEQYGYSYPTLAGYGNDGGFYYKVFVPAQEMKFPLMEYSKIIEKELVTAN